MDGPGRAGTRDGSAVEQKIISGQMATDRPGAAEYLDMPLNTVNMYSSPARRPRTGWPEPLPERIDGKDWFAIVALDDYRATRTSVPTAPPATDDSGDGPDALISRAEFARLRGVSTITMDTDVAASIPAWDRGEHGYLPRPALTEPARHGTGRTYYWEKRSAHAWLFPETPRRSSGRPPADQTVTVEDLQAVLAAAGDRAPALTQRDIAKALTERIGRQVSIQSVKRLRAKLRDGS